MVWESSFGLKNLRFKLRSECIRIKSCDNGCASISDVDNLIFWLGKRKAIKKKPFRSLREVLQEETVEVLCLLWWGVAASGQAGDCLVVVGATVESRLALHHEEPSRSWL